MKEEQRTARPTPDVPARRHPGTPRARGRACRCRCLLQAEGRALRRPARHSAAGAAAPPSGACALPPGSLAATRCALLPGSWQCARAVRVVSGRGRAQGASVRPAGVAGARLPQLRHAAKEVRRGALRSGSAPGTPLGTWRAARDRQGMVPQEQRVVLLSRGRRRGEASISQLLRGQCSVAASRLLQRWSRFAAPRLCCARTAPSTTGCRG